MATLVLLAWILGLALGYAGPALSNGGANDWPGPWGLIVVALLLLALAALALAAEARGWARTAVLAVLLVLGLARGAAAVHHSGPGTVDGYLGSTVAVVGTVESVSPPLSGAGGSTAGQQQRFRLIAETVASRGRVHVLSGLILVQARSQAQVWAGQRLTLSGRLARLRRLGPGGVAGYADRLEHQGVQAELSVGSLTALTPPPQLSLARVVQAIRQELVRSCRDLLPEPEATIILGETAGIRGRLPAGLDADLVDSGLVHLLAISGIKVAIIAGLLQAVAVGLAGRRAALGAIGGVGLYTLVGGASASALRSALMGSLALLARSLRRDPEVLRSLLLAAGLMLAWRPSLVVDLSFQYSFLGVLGIDLFAESAGRRLGAVPRPFREALAVTAAAQLATLPLTAHYFQVIPLAAPIANAIVLPTLPASIACGLLLAAAGSAGRASAAFFPAASSLLAGVEVALATLVLWLARLAIAIAHLTAHLPGAVSRVPNFDGAPTAAYYAGLAAGLIGHRRWPAPAAMAVGGCTGILVLLLLGRPDGHLHVSFLQAGGGPAVLVTAPDGATMLIDTGSQAAALATELDAALPSRLPGSGRRRIDAVVLTGSGHSEAGGLAALDTFNVALLVAPERLSGSAAVLAVSAAAHRGALVTWARPGDSLRWHGLEVQLAPASSQALAAIVRFGGESVAVLEASGSELAGVQPGDYAVVDVGQGTADLGMEGVRTKLLFAQDRAGKPVARALRQAYGETLWQSSKDGRVDVVCDIRRCWW